MKFLNSFKKTTFKIKFNNIRSTIISNVVPVTHKDLLSFCQKYIKSNPVVIGEKGVDVGFNILTSHPEAVSYTHLTLPTKA